MYTIKNETKIAPVQKSTFESLIIYKDHLILKIVIFVSDRDHQKNGTLNDESITKSMSSKEN